MNVQTAVDENQEKLSLKSCALCHLLGRGTLDFARFQKHKFYEN